LANTAVVALAMSINARMIFLAVIVISPIIASAAATASIA